MCECERERDTDRQTDSEREIGEDRERERGDKETLTKRGEAKSLPDFHEEN